MNKTYRFKSLTNSLKPIDADILLPIHTRLILGMGILLLFVMKHCVFDRLSNNIVKKTGLCIMLSLKEF